MGHSDLCLVTGGAGFIGSHLAEALTAAGRPVRVFDNFSTGLRPNLEALRPAPEIIEGDLTDAAEVRRAATGAGIVFHLGALASVAKSVEEPLASHAACATATLNVLEAARAAGARRVVYSASASAYGAAEGERGLDEDTPLTALSPYAAAKLAGEFYLQSFTATFGLETARVRFFNVFGPRQRADSPYSGVIAIFAAAMAAGRAPMIHGDGLQTRDFVYVADAVQALVKAAEVPAAAGRVYNIGTGRGTSVLDLVTSLNRLLGTDLQPKHGPARPGDIRHSCADISRARRDLGYEPTVSFQDGLTRTIAWSHDASNSGGRNKAI
jgi:nucleoside-diphosphate-sugar epimerase